MNKGCAIGLVSMMSASVASLQVAAAQTIDGLPCNRLCQAWLGVNKTTAAVAEPQHTEGIGGDPVGTTSRDKPDVTPVKGPLEDAPRSALPLASRPPQIRRPVQEAVKAPKLESPRPDRNNPKLVDLTWKSAKAPAVVRYFVEVRALNEASSTEIFSGFADRPPVRVTVPDQQGDYIWRVASVAPDAQRYAHSPWSRFKAVSVGPSAQQP